MVRKWLRCVVCCGLLAVWFPVQADECGRITTWNSNDASFFTSQEASVYGFENTPFPIPNLGGAMVTYIAVSLSGGPSIRVWSHENAASAQNSLENYWALNPWRGDNSHYYDEYYLIYKLDANGMVKTLDLIANYRGNLIEILTYFFGERSLSGELPIYALWFSQVKALIDSKCGTAGNPPTIALIPSPAQGLAFQISILENRVFRIKATDPDGREDLDWATFKVFIAGVDKTGHFISVLTSLPRAIGEESDETSKTFVIGVNPERFMAEENLFNIQWNGHWPVALEICDKSGNCGRSDYSIYFGPFLHPAGGNPGSVQTFSCEAFRFEIGDLVAGNLGYDCTESDIYFGLTRQDSQGFLATWTHPNAWVQNWIGPRSSNFSLQTGIFYRLTGFTYPQAWRVDDWSDGQFAFLESETLYYLHALILDPEATDLYLSTVGFELFCN